VTTQPDAELTRAFVEAAGPGKAKVGQLAVAVDDHEARARRTAHELFRFGVPGWKVMAELPNPVNFEAATENVREEDVAENVSCGPDAETHLQAIEEWREAGFDHVAIVQLGDTDRFFELWEQELQPRLRSGTQVSA